MNHQNHLDLLRNGVPTLGGIWADLGSGTGAFTLALAELIGPTGEIYSVDKDRGALQEQAKTMQRLFPENTLYYLKADFTETLELPLLDGIVMANSLHFVNDRHKGAVLQQIKAYMKPDGRILVVEYNTDSGNTWVPHPFAYPTWVKMAKQMGLENTRLLATYPSRFLHEIYAAASW
ncbi:MAG: class I SAM-dependent methyltransferase [Chloroflexi bacterium]|nr:class I SAM-dependent methyltransferase [Chloroflexota bacterium]